MTPGSECSPAVAVVRQREVALLQLCIQLPGLALVIGVPLAELPQYVAEQVAVQVAFEGKF